VKKSEAAEMVGFLLAAFPNARIASATGAVYEHMLADVDASVVQAVLERLIATSKFLPSVAEIRAAVNELHAGPKRPGGDAWGDVLRAISRFGSYRLPVFDDPLVDRAVAALGWRDLCLSENSTADRARFIQLYDELAVQNRTEAVTASLPAVKAHRELRASNERASETKRLASVLADLDPEGEA
jgi:hypothetical protein